ncbi:hypothetical protein ARMGADRAFT_1035037 [Armillaria gallica]|uniref:Uncharacterized protein n=1 Tax=Armillaria gallica TaxID=47427 RepID=A0A2H3DDI3_ARMGA|nr:hypothetical protein ARMGADRAFT_1035037 [Armillaria gallica]
MPNPRAISSLDSFDLLDFDSDYIPAVAGSAQLSILWLSHSSTDTPAPEGEQDRNGDSTADTVSELPIVPLSETRRGRQAHAENDSSNPTGNGSERTAKENINSQQKVASPQEDAASADEHGRIRLSIALIPTRKSVFTERRGVTVMKKHARNLIQSGIIDPEEIGANQ